MKGNAITHIIKYFALIVGYCCSSVPAFAQQNVLSDKSEIRFVSKQMNVPVEGAFRKFQSEINIDPNTPQTAKVIVNVDLNSIDMNNTEVETEARRKLWFNVSLFPHAKFLMTDIKRVGAGRYEARGNLSIKGITREILTPFTLRQQHGLSTAEGSFVLKRLDFKIGEGEWSDTGTVANEVLVRFRLVITGIPLIKQ